MSKSYSHKRLESNTSSVNIFTPQPRTKNGDFTYLKETTHVHNGTVFSSIFALSNVSIGSGILVLPYAFSNCGYILGLIALVSIGILNGTGLLQTFEFFFFFFQCHHYTNFFGL